MIVSKKELNRRFKAAYWSAAAQRHLHDAIALAARDPEYARQQIDVLVEFVAATVVDGRDPGPSWRANSRPPNGRLPG